MIEIILNPEEKEISSLIKRPAQRLDHLMDVVGEVFESVKKDGDVALRNYTEKFDKAVLSTIQVSPAEIEEAKKVVPDTLKYAIEVAKDNIYTFHASQKLTSSPIETVPGVECWRKQVPIEKVGLYVPGGSAPLFSSVLMLGIPAILAGCKQIVLCTPPASNGSIHPAILYAADLVGIKKVYKVGGIQAIAAMALGTDSIPKVYKIFGPGNSYVTAAKEFANRMDVAIDMPAGPSEVMILADAQSNPRFVAADILSQAEHGPDSQCILLSTDTSLLNLVQVEIRKQLEQLSRKEIAIKSLNNSKLVGVSNVEKMIEIANEYAPEHLIIATQEADVLAEKVINAGSVFIGPYASESFGDYASGTNHALPTAGFAKVYSGVSLDSFVKNITFQRVTQTGFNNLATTVETMAEWEQLDAHKFAVSVRRMEI